MGWKLPPKPPKSAPKWPHMTSNLPKAPPKPPQKAPNLPQNGPKSTRSAPDDPISTPKGSHPGGVFPPQPPQMRGFYPKKAPAEAIGSGRIHFPFMGTSRCAQLINEELIES